EQPQQYYKKPLREHEKPQDLNKVPGSPGVDYPIYHSVPHTNFHCGNVPVHPGMYANVETGCQAYHICHDGREGDQGASFLCTNGTLFNQHIFACDWWYNVDCAQATSLYSLNADPEKNPFVPKKKPEDELKKSLHNDYY
ncbi:U-scoloptoxin(01)-Cw1a-like, partial [Arctopsyche grandis]|uniref:U-scoloptoxin(01)-Cw1a-like n=1 Tax=Arctopsyche grandis TaxID=121162 RepID=UPI00406D795E